MTISDVGFGLLISVVISFFALIPYLFVMHLLMPRAVRDRYWKEPHFYDYERAIYVGIFSPLRTLVMIAAFARKKAAMIRRMTDVSEVVPTWYRTASLVFVVWLIVTTAGLAVLGSGLLIAKQLSGDLLVSEWDWKFVGALAVMLVAYPLAYWMHRRRRRTVNRSARR